VPREQRARWRSRRGMLELDVLLNRFIDACYTDLDSAQQDDFDNLLEQSDVDLYAWFTGRGASPDSHIQALVQKIRQVTD
jgi:antitoxin CptB